MSTPLPETSPVRRRIELALAAALLIWRILARPPGLLWRDWGIVVALVWIFAVLAPRSRARPTVVSAAAAWLLGLYVKGQLPLMLSILGLAP